MDWLNDPEWLWHNTGKGREEFVQDLLAALICGGLPGKWDHRVTPSADGAVFLTKLHGRHFDETPDSGHLFVNEYQLPARHEDEGAGWPDYGVEWDERLFLIELKSERRSHRAGQIRQYMEQGVHHNPGRPVDVLYVTPDMEIADPDPVDGSRYAWCSWASLQPLIEETWISSDLAWQPPMVAVLNRWLDEVEAGSALPERVRAAEPAQADDLLTQALGLAAKTQADGEQRALESGDRDPEELERLRLEVRDAINKGASSDGIDITHVRPWIWTGATSTGTALTDGGTEHGVELRFSKYAKPVVPNDV